MRLLMTHNQAEPEQTDDKRLPSVREKQRALSCCQRLGGSSAVWGEGRYSVDSPSSGICSGHRIRREKFSSQPPTPLCSLKHASWLTLLRYKAFLEPACAAALLPARIGEGRSQRIKETGAGAPVSLPGFASRPKPQALYLLWLRNCPVSARRETDRLLTRV